MILLLEPLLDVGGTLFLLAHRLALGKLRHEGVQRIVALAPPVEDQIAGERRLFGRDLVQRHDLGGMQNCAGQPALERLIEKHRVEHVAGGRVEAERDVREPEDDLNLRELGADRGDRIERRDPEAAVVLVAGADREGQGVDQKVRAWQAVAVAGEVDQAAGDLELASHVLGHAGLVDRQRDHAGAELARELHALRGRLLAVLEVDRVQDRLAAIELERGLEHRQLGRIEHQRAVDGAAQARDDLGHVAALVATDVGGADVERVRALLGLGAADRDAGIPVAGRLALAECLGAIGVAAFADRQISLLLA